MMLVKHTLGLTLDLQLNLDRWYIRHLTPRDRREPACRHLFIITKPGNEELLTVLATATAASPFDAFPDPMFETELEQVLEHAQTEAPSTLAAREAENARLRQLVDGYKQGRFTHLMQRVHRWRCRLTCDRNAE